MRITMMCLRNLLRRRFRTSLCLLGIAIATMFIVGIGATTTRYAAVIREMNVFFSGDVVVVAKGSFVVQGFPIGGALQERTVEDVKEVEGVKNAVPMLFVIASEGFIQPVPLNISIGVPAGNWSVLVGLTPLRPGGTWPSGDLSEKETVIGPSLADQHNFTVGSNITVKNYELEVKGVLDTRSALLSRVIILPLELAQDVYGYNMLINMVIVEPDEGVTESKLADRIEEEIGGVRALTGVERNEMVEPLLHDIETWNLGIRSVLFFLSIVLVMTVAMINVSERRRDFATLAAIGAPRSSIVRMVITETGLIGLFGGLAGILLGMVATLLLASFYTNIPISVFIPDIFIIVSPTLMTEILLSTIAISCIAGILPAITAARASIAEVLRAEY